MMRRMLRFRPMPMASLATSTWHLGGHEGNEGKGVRSGRPHRHTPHKPLALGN